MEVCQEDLTVYWKGLWHGMLLMLPVLAFFFRKWKVAAEHTAKQQPVLGTSFLNELFAFEVVLVAGAELKAVRDQLKSAEETLPVNEKKVEAIKGRIVDVATVLQKKLETITPLVSFLLEESVGVIKDHHKNLFNIEAKKDI